MPIPAVIGLISKILGGVSAAKGLSGEDKGGIYTEPKYSKKGMVGNIVGNTAANAYGQEQEMGQEQPSRLQGFAGKAGSIANLISSLRGMSGGGQYNPYQIQLNRRRM